MNENDPLPGWIGLAVAGGSNIVYGLIYLAWSLFSLITSGLMSIGVAIDQLGGSDPGVAIPYAIAAFMPLISCVVFLIVPVMGLITLFGAFRFYQHRSKGLIYLGILSAIGAPLLGLVTSVTSLCNIGAGCTCCVGFIGGNIGTIIDGAIVLFSVGFAVVVLTRPETQAAFEAAAAEA